MHCAAKYNPETEDEVARKKQETKLKEERERFKLHADGAKAVWAATIALYVAVLLKVS